MNRMPWPPRAGKAVGLKLCAETKGEQGDVFSRSAAKAPAFSPNRNAVKRNISQVVAINSKMNGTSTASDPVSFMAAQAIQNESGGWLK
jgi:hypothetical protein